MIAGLTRGTVCSPQFEDAMTFPPRCLKAIVALFIGLFAWVPALHKRRSPGLRARGNGRRQASALRVLPC
jgi:hypothetical protein